MFWFIQCYCLCVTEFVFDTVLTTVRDLVSFVQGYGWIASEDFILFCYTQVTFSGTAYIRIRLSLDIPFDFPRSVLILYVLDVC